MTRKNFRFSMVKVFVFGLLAAGATAAGVQAAPTTFTFDGSTKGQTSIVKSLDGIVMTLDNFTAGPASGADSDGLAVYCVPNGWSVCGYGNQYSSFTITFDKPVRLLSYNVSYRNYTNDSTTTYSQGPLQSIQPNTADGLVAFTNPFLAAANVPITVSTFDANGDGFLQINNFTVEYVPVPGPLPLLGASAAFSWSRRLRDRIRRSPLA